MTIDVEKLRAALYDVRADIAGQNMDFKIPFHEERVMVIFKDFSIILTGRIAFGVRDCQIVYHERLDNVE